MPPVFRTRISGVLIASVLSQASLSINTRGQDAPPGQSNWVGRQVMMRTAGVKLRFL
jgi:hypothetical protein